AEAASLREAWLAFGQLVRAADASLPAMPDIAVPDRETPEIAAAILPRKRRRNRWVGLLAATSAALLVAITLGWWIGRDRKQHDNQPSLAHNNAPEHAKPQAVKQDPPQSALAREANATKQPAKAGAIDKSNTVKSTIKSSTWDDPLES